MLTTLGLNIKKQKRVVGLVEFERNTKWKREKEKTSGHD